MFRTILASSRYLVLIAIFATFLGAVALMIFEATVVVVALVEIATATEFTPKNAKRIAVGLIEAVDVFLIAIAMYMMSLSLYALFVDEKLPLPKWLKVSDLEDLKANLVSIVIAVLAVLFLRQAVAWEEGTDILALGVSLALVIASLTFFLAKKSTRQD
jgi:uncharacterized membrane protein YqhA